MRRLMFVMSLVFVSVGCSRETPAPPAKTTVVGSWAGVHGIALLNRGGEPMESLTVTIGGSNGMLSVLGFQFATPHGVATKVYRGEYRERFEGAGVMADSVVTFPVALGQTFRGVFRGDSILGMVGPDSIALVRR